jgi:hypothetical protein
MPEDQIPNPLIAEVSDALAWFHTHSQLGVVFQRSGAPGDPPQGNKIDKCSEWLRRINNDETVSSLAVLGGVLEEFLEKDSSSHPQGQELQQRQERVKQTLARFGLTYQRGGQILGGNTATPTRTLQTIIRGRDLGGLEAEFSRTLSSVESDPPAAVTAASAIIESLCKVYIQDNRLQMPSDQSVKPLWRAVQGHLGLNPSSVSDQDMAKLLGSLSGIVDAIGAFRTHAGSAHGRGRGVVTTTPAHARLAIHAAHTLTAFVLEVWNLRTSSPAVSNP